SRAAEHVPVHTLCACLFVVFFFFSSRRRHTRFSRDWSSDVCSSDLAVKLGIAPVLLGVLLVPEDARVAALYVVTAAYGAVGHLRSEERRVGKECRSRWWPAD